MNNRYAFVFATDSPSDSGYREITGASCASARAELLRQLTAEGQHVRIDAAQETEPHGRAPA